MGQVRTASADVSHMFRRYVCNVRWNEERETIDLVAVTHHGTSKRATPSVESEVYVKALADPQIRSAIIRALFPENRRLVNSSAEDALTAGAESTGFWIGLGVFCLVGAGIYWIFRYLARELDEEWASLITYLPSFFAFLVVFPVRRFYVSYAKRRYCAKYGHILDQFVANDGRQVVTCKRCYVVLQGSPK